LDVSDPVNRQQKRSAVSKHDRPPVRSPGPGGF